MDPPALVRESTARVMQQASHVSIDVAAVDRLAGKLGENLSQSEQGIVTWDSGDFHYFQDVEQDGPLTCHKKCFFFEHPQCIIFSDSGYNDSIEYEHLARGLKTAVLRDAHTFDAANLKTVSKETVQSWFHPFTPPQLSERRRKVQEVGDVLHRFFDGQALNLIKQAKHSAVEAVRLVLAYFPADYRVPQVLRAEQVLVYSTELANLIDSKAEIAAGSEMEVELRAATIQAVEGIHKRMQMRGHCLAVVELDWLLWQIGEDRKTHLLPHHRTWSIYY
ncbi:hypothetical protein PsorP6_006990 [Peronosclerospora sorghi]|uniref:Uncharacterized protein n=1 Tax=Peronosclerospora sorghi TaxID=230839 RepID=A0ACC0WBQ7_9STRA|nr:hypothetical protein PsorP6_006990 [Peronosclerospora sorghi]